MGTKIFQIKENKATVFLLANTSTVMLHTLLETEQRQEWSCENPGIKKVLFKLKFKTLCYLFYGWGSTVSRLQSHYKETNCFLP